MSFLIDLLFPRTCSGCGSVGSYLCHECQLTLTHKGISTPKKSAYDGCLSMYRYKGVVKQLITDLKFRFVTDIVDNLTDLMVYTLINNYPHILRYWQENKFALIPIPLHPRRHAWRGFNQSELICQKLSTKLNLVYIPDILIRIKNTIPQTIIKDKRLRRANTQSSFKLKIENCKIEDYRNLILVDDVYTTGSTVKSATSVFPKNTNIWALTIAG